MAISTGGGEMPMYVCMYVFKMTTSCGGERGNSYRYTHKHINTRACTHSYIYSIHTYLQGHYILTHTSIYTHIYT